MSASGILWTGGRNEQFLSLGLWRHHRGACVFGACFVDYLRSGQGIGMNIFTAIMCVLAVLWVIGIVVSFIIEVLG